MSIITVAQVTIIDPDLDWAYRCIYDRTLSFGPHVIILYYLTSSHLQSLKIESHRVILLYPPFNRVRVPSERGLDRPNPLSSLLNPQTYEVKVVPSRSN